MAADGDIAGRTSYDADRFAVNLHVELTGLNPTRIAHLKCELTLTLGNGNLAILCIGETGLLTKHNAAFLPVQLCRYEEVYEQVVALMGIDKLTVLAVVLHTRTNAAPHRFVRS